MFSRFAVVIFLLFQLGFSQDTYARFSSANQMMGKYERQYFQAAQLNSGQNPEGQRAILLELLGTETPGYNWPGFPRTWSRVTDWKTERTTTSFGADINLIAFNLGIGLAGAELGVGYKVNFKYAYTFYHTLVVMSSYQGTTSEQIVEGPLSQVTRLDSGTHKTYFKSSEERPMVGFCMIEAALEMSFGDELGIRYIVGKHSSEDESGTSVSHALYSKFFQIEPDVPMSHYMDVYCKEEFSLYARPIVEADFNNIVIDKSINANPANRCQVEDVDNVRGDDSCAAWHVSHYTKDIVKKTVARCGFSNDDGIGRCELRGGKGDTCWLWPDEKGNLKESAAGFATYRRTCDDGLTCKMLRPPVKIFNTTIWPGTATCQ